MLGHAERVPEERLRGGGAEAVDRPRAHDPDLRLEPRATRPHLAGGGLLVDAALPPRLPLEVLDSVRHVHAAPVYPGDGEGAVEEAPRGPDEGPSGQVLLVA